MARPPLLPRRAEPDEFGVVLGLLLTAYLLFALSAQRWATVVVALLYLAALVFAIRTSRPGPRARRALFGLLVLAVTVNTLAALVLPEPDAIGVLEATYSVLLACTLVTILVRILSRPDVTLQAVAGALSAYLLLGMLFANVFGVVDWLQPGDFFAGGQVADQRSLQYFSFTTLTTVGYGDYTAADFTGRNLATLEALVAQIFLATLVARLVAGFHRPQRRGAEPTQPAAEEG